MEKQKATEPPPTGGDDLQAENNLDDARRDALKRIAKWTPPAMLTLLTPANAQGFSPPPPPP